MFCVLSKLLVQISKEWLGIAENRYYVFKNKCLLSLVNIEIWDRAFPKVVVCQVQNFMLPFLRWPTDLRAVGSAIADKKNAKMPCFWQVLVVEYDDATARRSVAHLLGST